MGDLSIEVGRSPLHAVAVAVLLCLPQTLQPDGVGVARGMSEERVAVSADEHRHTSPLRADVRAGHVMMVACPRDGVTVEEPSDDLDPLDQRSLANSRCMQLDAGVGIFVRRVTGTEAQLNRPPEWRWRVAASQAS